MLSQTLFGIKHSNGHTKSRAMKSLLNFSYFDGLLEPKFLSEFQIFSRTWQRRNCASKKSNNFALNKKHRVWWKNVIEAEDNRRQCTVTKNIGAQIWIAWRDGFYVSSRVLFVCFRLIKTAQSSIKALGNFFAWAEKFETLARWQNFSSIRRELNFKFSSKKALVWTSIISHLLWLIFVLVSCWDVAGQWN